MFVFQVIDGGVVIHFCDVSNLDLDTAFKTQSGIKMI